MCVFGYFSVAVVKCHEVNYKLRECHCVSADLTSYSKSTELTRDVNNKGLAWSSVVECFLGFTANTTNNISIIIVILLIVIVR